MTPGTYTNPVLNADWSDPDVIRVGDDYYLTASSFGRVPGLPLLHSRDLVSWTLVGHALDTLEPAARFGTPRHDCGVWAPSLRHHDERFWIFWGDPDQGVFQVNAPEIRGPWTRPHLVEEGKGLIDPCPLWDEDSGEAYLVHAWARSRSGIGNRLTGHRMRPDGTGLLDAGRTVVDADRVPGWFTLEGPKLYRHDGWFWILAPAGGVATGWQGAFRSRDFFGPYEERIVLEQGAGDVNGPHQGGWVRTPAGQDWFLHFQQRGAYGRVVHLQPMRWSEPEAGRPGARGDGAGPATAPVGPARWPVIGDEGTPVTTYRRPALPAQPPAAPATDDDFPGGRFGRQWQWTANPRDGWATQHGGDGLRLTCVRSADAHDLRRLPNVLTQRLPGAPCSVEAELRLDSTEPGARAGLAVLGDAYRWIGLERGPDGAVLLVHRFAEPAAATGAAAPTGTPAVTGSSAPTGTPAVTGSSAVTGSLATPGNERDAAVARPVPDGRARLRIDIGPHARCRFSSDTGAGPRPAGPVFAATPWRWVGALLGLFAVAPGSEGHAGAATFTTFRITPS